MHCHVFNAADLPTDGFIRRVVFGNYERRECPSALDGLFDPFLEGLARLVIAILRSGAPTAREELAWLDGVSATDEQAPTEDEEIIILRRALNEVLSPPPAALDSIDDEAVRDALLEAILDEIEFPADSAAPAAPEALARPLYASLGKIGRHIRWAFLLIRSRRHIVSRLSALYPDAKLFTPALVDFSRWLDDPTDVDLEGQMLVMDRLQRRTENPAMHGFMAFDPWRQIVEEAQRVRTSLDLVQTAILEHGFIGVKLYPPMGFRPAMNDGAGLCFPARALRAFPNFPGDIDRALAALFDWCHEEDVAILAHATNSNGSNAGFGERANPKYWKHALEGRETLRLALAHFGRFDEDNLGTGERIWEHEFGELVATGRYPNAYADLSYLSEVLQGSESSSGRERVERRLAEFLNSYPEAADRLLYGSDWIMLGREPNPGSSIRELVALLERVGMTETQIADVIGRNALRYFGIHEPGTARDRIEAYRVKHQLTMDAIDGLMA